MQGLPQLKEKLARLEHENKMLREQAERPPLSSDTAAPQPTQTPTQTNNDEELLASQELTRKAMSKTNASLQDELDRLQKDHKLDLDQKDDELKLLNDKKISNERQLSSEISHLKAQKEATKERLAEIESRNNELKLNSNAQQAQIEEDKTKIEILNAAIKVKVDEMKILQDQLSANKKTVKDHSDKVKELEHELKKLSERASLSKGINVEHQTTIMTLTKSVEDITLVIKEKTDKIDEISNKLLVSEKNKLKLTGEKATIEANTTKLNSQISTQKAR